MADDNLKNLIKNYSSMPIGELGDALLSRQAGQRSKARSRRRKAEKINNILAVLLGGQAVFNKTASQRVKELESLNTVNKYKDSILVKKMNMVGKALKSIDADILTADNALDLIRNNKEEAEKAYAGIAPFLEKHIKDGLPREHKFMEQGMGGALETEKRRIFFDQILPYYLGKEEGKTETRAQILMRTGSKYFNGDFTPEELMEKFAGFEMDEAKIARERSLQESKRAVRDESSLWNVFGVAGGLFKGDAGPFKEITEIEDPALHGTLSKIPLTGFFGVDAGEVYRDVRNSVSYEDIAVSQGLNSTAAASSARNASARLLGLLQDDLRDITRAGASSDNYRDNWMVAASRIREVDYGNNVIFTDTPKATDAISQLNVGMHFGRTRVQLERDIKFIENINNIDEYTTFIKKHFGESSIEGLTTEEKDILSMKIVYDLAMEPRNPEDYAGVGGGPNLGTDVGELAINKNPGKERSVSISRPGDPEGNFVVLNSSKVDFMISNMAKGIDNGQIQWDERITSFLSEMSSVEDYKLAAQRMQEELRYAKEHGGLEFGEKYAQRMRTINPKVTKMFDAPYNFGSQQGLIDALYSDDPISMTYMPDSTMPPASSSVGSTDDQMEDWIKDSYQYSQGDGYLNPDVGAWVQRKKEEPFIKDIQKYYESPGSTGFQIKYRQQAFDDALKGLGITKEEAEKYRIGQ